MITDLTQLRDHLQTLLQEDMTEDQLAPVFNQVVSEFDRLLPSGVDLTKELRTKTTANGQYKLALGALLEVLERHLASELRAEAFRATTKDLQNRVAGLQRDISSRLRR